MSDFIDDNIELYIIKGLLTIQDYTVKFIDVIKTDHFSAATQPIVRMIRGFYLKHRKSPSPEILIDILLPKLFNGDQEKVDKAEEVIQNALSATIDKEKFYDFLVDETKNFIKFNSMQLALMESVDLIAQGKMSEAVKKVNDASNLSFDDNLGLDYFEDLAERIERMKSGVHIIPSGMKRLDDKIGGGWHNKSLVIFGAATNVGKTLILGDVSYKLIKQGLNGLYITLEIYQDLLANRIDANLSDIEMSELNTDPDLLFQVINKEKEEADAAGVPYGRFIIKEYAPNCLNCNQILTFVRELNLKRNGFKPDFIAVDYIGLLAPNGKSFSDNTYGKLKSVAEELRTVASVLDIPVFSAVQVNRDGMNASHVGMENTSDSVGIPMTADVMIMVTRDDDMNAESKMRWFVAKSRYSRNGESFIVDADYNHMRITADDEEKQDAKQRAASKACAAALKASHTTKAVIKQPTQTIVNNASGKNLGEAAETENIKDNNDEKSKPAKKALNI
jgi:replicative DNA helicase